MLWGNSLTTIVAAETQWQKITALLAQGARIRVQGWKSTENLSGEMLAARETTEGVWTKSEYKLYQNPWLTAKLHIFEGTFQGIQQKHRQRSEKHVHLILLLTESPPNLCAINWMCVPQNSYFEALILNLIIFRGGAFGGRLPMIWLVPLYSEEESRAFPLFSI